MVNQQIRKTLLYSDIFDYPLTLHQIWKYLLTNRRISKKDVRGMLKKQKISQKKDLYFLNNRDEIVPLRQIREKESARKINFARRKTKILKLIPTIKLLGISGSLSMKNADKSDDIDLFIVTSKDRVWTTRLITVLLFKSLGLYRNKDEKKPANKFCVNMLIDEANLLFPKKRQDIYSAHEIVQILPIFQRDNVYTEFINTNFWIKKIMANFTPKKIRNEKTSFTSKLCEKILAIIIFEKLAKWTQISYMKKKKNKETITDGFLAFHPKDPRKKLLQSYKTKLKEYSFMTLGH